MFYAAIAVVLLPVLASGLVLINMWKASEAEKDWENPNCKRDGGSCECLSVDECLHTFYY